MAFLRADVVRHVADEPQPGSVECAMVDAAGITHTFKDKAPVFSDEPLLAASDYPVACEIACEVEDEWIGQNGTLLVRICTERPWSIASVAGETRFVVFASQLRREN